MECMASSILALKYTVIVYRDEEQNISTILAILP